MVKLPWFSLYAEDWITSPSLVRMNCAQEGAYIRLLCHAWLEKDCGLPQETAQLMKLARWRGRSKGFEAVEECLIVHPENPSRYTNRRLFEEWKKSRHISESNKKAAEIRWNRSKAALQPVQGRSKGLDRTSKGFSPISNEVHSVADKWFPPQ